MKRPEILSPAGNFEKMCFAINYGADAVYLAGKEFGMRTSSDNFSNEEIAKAIEFAHKKNKKVYVTVNIMPHPEEEKKLPNYLSLLNEMKPDALIISDLGVFSLAKKYAPNIEKHISTQANTVNVATCNMWYQLGATRIVLARELSLNEITEIKSEIPKELELEVFVHGSMCVSHSGRCLLSNYYTQRDANRGACAQPCRWEYHDKEKYTEIFEKKRPEQILSVVENESGTFMFASKDMCMIEHIPELVNLGIESFKIEGRVKSAYYTAVTANAYKNELNSYLQDPENYKFNPKTMYELESVSHREYCTGYFFDNPMQNAQIAKDGGYIKDKSFLATVDNVENDRAFLIQRNKLSEGELIEIVAPGKECFSMFAEDLRTEKGEKIDSAPHPRMIFSIKANGIIEKGNIIRAGN